ncbi:MAG: alpha/beta hydrolase [Sulfuritalea sp.]|nr:alpha/beta hydrolase [Sulfuritalea sp.]
MAELMTALGHVRFHAAGHARGARVLHRLCLDHPARVASACIIDIAPTLATAYFHWFFLIQAAPLVLWGTRGFVGRNYDVPALWREKARDVRGSALDCGHFLPEELHAEVANAMRGFIAGIGAGDAG